MHPDMAALTNRLASAQPHTRAPTISFMHKRRRLDLSPPLLTHFVYTNRILFVCFLGRFSVANRRSIETTDRQHDQSTSPRMTSARIGMPAQYEMLASFSPTVFSHSPPASFDYSVSDR